MKPETVSGRECKINFWDLSGHPEFFEVRNEFYKDTQGVRRAPLLAGAVPIFESLVVSDDSQILLVFDVTSRRSFEALEAWLREAASFGVAANVCSVLCGNKVCAFLLPSKACIFFKCLIRRFIPSAAFSM